MQFKQEISTFDLNIEGVFNEVSKLERPTAYTIYEKIVEGLEGMEYSVPLDEENMLAATDAHELSELVASGVYTHKFKGSIEIGGIVMSSEADAEIEVKIVEFSLPHETWCNFYGYKVFVGDGHGTYLESYE